MKDTYLIRIIRVLRPLLKKINFLRHFKSYSEFNKHKSFYLKKNKSHYSVENIDSIKSNLESLVGYGQIEYTNKEFYKKNQPKFRKEIVESTTGSSGEPFHVYVDSKTEAKKHGLRLFVNTMITGKDAFPLKIRLWRHRKRSFFARLRGYINNEIYLEVFDDLDIKNMTISKKKILSNLEFLSSLRQGEILDGYVSIIVLYSKIIIQENINLSNINLVVTGGEELTRDDREIIETAFPKALVFDRYGSTEFSIIGHQCKWQAKHRPNEYHLFPNRHFVEISDNKELIITDLDNNAMPFYRYKTKDYAKDIKPAEKCNCGLSTPTIRGIKGRKNVTYETEKGHLSSHVFQSIFKKNTAIHQYQVRQLSLSEFEIYLVTDDNILEDSLKSKLPLGLNYKIEIVNKIPSKNGKALTDIPL